MRPAVARWPAATVGPVASTARARDRAGALHAAPAHERPPPRAARTAPRGAGTPLAPGDRALVGLPRAAAVRRAALAQPREMVRGAPAIPSARTSTARTARPQPRRPATSQAISAAPSSATATAGRVRRMGRGLAHRGQRPGSRERARRAEAPTGVAHRVAQAGGARRCALVATQQRAAAAPGAEPEREHAVAPVEMRPGEPTWPPGGRLRTARPDPTRPAITAVPGAVHRHLGRLPRGRRR